MADIQRGNISISQFVNTFKASNTFQLELVGDVRVWIFDIGDSPQIIAALTGKGARD